MFTNTIKNWWQQYCETNRCSNLRRELWLLLYGDGNEDRRAQILIRREKSAYPGKLESWYLEKAIYNLRRKFAAY